MNEKDVGVLASILDAHPIEKEASLKGRKGSAMRGKASYIEAMHLRETKLAENPHCLDASTTSGVNRLPNRTSNPSSLSGSQLLDSGRLLKTYTSKAVLGDKVCLPSSSFINGLNNAWISRY